jgi:hypothetical protein
MASRADCRPRLAWFSSCRISEVCLHTIYLSQKFSEAIERPWESFLWPQGDQPTAPWEFLMPMERQKTSGEARRGMVEYYR